MLLKNSQVNGMESLVYRNDQPFRALIDGWPEETALYDGAGRCRYVNAAMAAAFGGVESLLDRTPTEAWPNSLHAPFLQARLREVLAGRRTVSLEIGLGPAAQKRLARLAPLPSGEGAFLVARDVSERERDQRTKERLNRALRLLSACNQTLVHAIDEQRLLEDICRLVVESGGYRMAWVGYALNDPPKTVRPMAVAGAERDYLKSVRVSWADDAFGRGPTGTAIRTRATVVNPDFLTEATALPWREAAAARGYRSSIALPLIENGEVFGALMIYAAEAGAFSPEEIRLLEEMAGDLAFGVATLRSNARREVAETRLAFLASHDPLTGLLNRPALRQRFEAIKRGGGSAALLFIDLDNFKQINDSFDHAAGDRLLTEIADRLRAVAGEGGAEEGGAVCRQGGDEFVVMLPGAGPAEAARTADAVLGAVAQPVNIAAEDAGGGEAGEVAVAASIGIALYPDDGGDFDTVLKHADLALHQVKEQGGGESRFFKPDMAEKTAARWRMIANLRRGLQNGELSLHYQPQIDLRTGQVVGAEALARWRPGGGGRFVPPCDFIPAAEQSGLIVPLGEWALFEACAQAAAWRRDGVADLVMAVNLSAVQFRRADVARTVAAALEAADLPADRLELELTESLLLDDSDNVRKAIDALKERGVRFSIDDFGSGYSSLSYLKRLAVDKLKIDQSFVRDLPQGGAGDRETEDVTKDGAAAIVQAIIQLGAVLGLTVVAEGVETAAQRDILRRFGCHQGQGYLFARPAAAEDFPVALQHIQAAAEIGNNLAP